MAGIKHDLGKPDTTLVTTSGLLPLIRAMEYGCAKYARGNYLGGMEMKRLLAASKRHIDAICEGKWYDEESGNTHLGHAMASLYMLSATVGIKTATGLEDFGYSYDNIGLESKEKKQ